MGRLSDYAKQRILHLQRKNHKICEIVKLLANEDIKTTRLTVLKHVRQFRKLQLKHLDFIDGEMEKKC